MARIQTRRTISLTVGVGDALAARAAVLGLSMSEIVEWLLVKMDPKQIRRDASRPAARFGTSLPPSPLTMQERIALGVLPAAPRWLAPVDVVNAVRPHMGAISAMSALGSLRDRGLARRRNAKWQRTGVVP